MNIDPNTTKYLITAILNADGIVDKPDVVGAIFGQTEGLLGEELDLRDLQKSGRIGRIEVEVKSNKGKSEGKVLIPSSLDQVETAILAASLETIDRVGPCKAHININTVEDVRAVKRTLVVDRARELLQGILESSKEVSGNITESVRSSVQVQEIMTYGSERCPAGPNVQDSDAIIVVEGRNDVLNLLKAGIRNTIAVGGTNVPKTIQELSKERVVTAFVDGDRGGELVLRELLQVAEVDFIARAPQGKEVEELTNKQIMKGLRNKLPADQFVDMYNINVENGGSRNGDKNRKEDKDSGKNGKKGSFQKKKEQKKPFNREKKTEKKEEKELSPEQEKFRDELNELSGSFKARIYTADGKLQDEIPVKEMAEYLSSDMGTPLKSVIFDGVVTQRILDISSKLGVETVVGNKVGSVTKIPSSVSVLTKNDLS